MKVRDEAEWQGQLAEFASDENPLAALFRDFVIAWADNAETAMERRVITAEYDDRPPPGPVDALRSTLRATEDVHGHFEIGFVGMALLILCTHWEPAGDPDTFYEKLNSIEQNLFSDVARVKMATLEQAAAGE